MSTYKDVYIILYSLVKYVIDINSYFYIKKKCSYFPTINFKVKWNSNGIKYNILDIIGAIDNELYFWNI